MPSRVKILPSDVLLLIIDYLDSPTMMNCREVCKDWLDVEDGNRSLWDYFYDPKESHRPTTMKMLKVFSSKSNHNIKAFEIHVDSSAKPLEKEKKSEASAQIIQTLLTSNRSLRVWSNQSDRSDYEFISLFLHHLHKFQNLKSFCGLNHSGLKISSRFRTHQSTDQNSLPNDSLPSLLKFVLSFRVHLQFTSVLEASTSTLVHLKLNVFFLTRMRVANFPRLRILELIDYDNEFDKEWSSPNLKLLSVGLGGFSGEPSNLVNHFPSSVEEIWLVAPRSMMASFSKRGMSSLKKYYPKVEKLRFDSNVTFHPAEVISVVQARKEAFRKGIEVEGVRLKPIKILTLDFKRLQPAQLSQLQKLVPEVVDAGIAPKELVVDC